MNKTEMLIRKPDDDEMPVLREVKKMTGYYKQHALNLDFPEPPETPSLVAQEELP